MHLDRVDVADWRGYQQASLSLGTSGLLVLAGANNAGKTALLGALDVLAALEVPAGMRRKGSTQRARILAQFTLTDEDVQQMAAATADAAGFVQADAFRRLHLQWEDIDDQRMALTKAVTYIGQREVNIVSVVATDDSGNREATLLSWDWLGRVRATDVVDPQTEIPWSRMFGTASELDQDYFLRGFQALLAEWRSRYLHFASLRLGTQARRPLASAPRLEAAGANLPEALLYLKTNSDDTWAAMQALMRDVLPELGELAVRTDDHVRVSFADRSTGTELNLKDLGTGVEQLLLAAYAGLAHPAGGVVVIEEPEGSLHPGAQRQLLGHLRQWSADRALIISTHSPVMLDQPGRQVWVASRAAGTSRLNRTGSQAPGALAELGVRLSDVLSAERILLVEGPSDQDVLDVWFGATLEAGRAVMLTTNGSDATWQVPTVEAAFEAADSLGRTLLVLRDRDELPDDTLDRLRAKPVMWVLERRELENYLLDLEAISATLRGLGVTPAPEPAVLGADLAEAANALRASVVLRRTAARFPVIRLFDRRWTRSCLREPSLASMLARVEEVLPVPAEIARDVEVAWAEEEAWLADRWETEQLSLCPGSELLDHLWRKHDLRYDKRRDGPVLASRIAEPPTELARAVSHLLEN